MTSSALKQRSRARLELPAGARVGHLQPSHRPDVASIGRVRALDPAFPRAAADSPRATTQPSRGKVPAPIRLWARQSLFSVDPGLRPARIFSRLALAATYPNRRALSFAAERTMRTPRLDDPTSELVLRVQGPSMHDPL